MSPHRINLMPFSQTCSNLLSSDLLQLIQSNIFWRLFFPDFHEICTCLAESEGQKVE